MAKFSQVAKGATARKRVSFTLMDGTAVECAVIPLLVEADAEILAGARKHAMDRGVADPKDGDPLYEQGIWIHTIVRGCVDPDSPENAPQPFFDGGAQQILHPTLGLDRDRIAFLFEAQQAWQDECSLRPGKLTAGEFFAELVRHAELPEGAELPFERWRPVLRRSFVRSMAVRLGELLQLRSLLGPDSPATTTGSGKPAPNTTASSEETSS